MPPCLRIQDKLPQIVCDIAWLVEGRSAAELPEGVVGCMRLDRLEMNDALDAAAFFAPPSGHNDAAEKR